MGTGTSWDSWMQQVGGGVIDKWASATYQQPYEIQKLKIQALGEQGYYSEGQPGATSAQRQGFALTPGVMLLAGAAVLAVVLLKD